MISDTHTKHNKIEIPECDLLIHSGDYTSMGYLREVEDFLKWFTALDQAKHKIYIEGNHDFNKHTPYIAGLNNNLARGYGVNEPGTNIYNLLDSYVDIEGIQIYGTPWTPRFYNWAFMGEPGADLAKKYNKIPHGTDILISHGPPYGFGDKTEMTVDHVGSQDLLNRILEVKPKLVVYGHIHDGFGMYSITDDITGFNVSVLDDHYNIVNEPVVINYYDFV